MTSFAPQAAMPVSLSAPVSVAGVVAVVVPVAADLTVPRPTPQPRNTFRHFSSISTRWMDNDAYGHINNVVYYSYFDTVVNQYLIEAGALDIERSPLIGLVVETHCNYFSPLSFPQLVDVGLRVAQLGKSSVRYHIGLFASGEPTTAAHGHFVHVYVDRVTRRPAELSPVLLQALQGLM